MVQAVEPEETMLLDGGSGNSSAWTFIPRWPVFQQYIPPGIIDINITHPIENETYYTNTQNLTANITGNTSTMYCYYKINDGAWNTFNCINQQVTFQDQ